MTVQFQRTIPILRIFDEQKAKEFYVDYLGFQVDWEHRYEPGMPLYMQVSREGLVLHLSEHHGDGTPGSAIFVDMTGIEAFHRELTAKHYKYYRPCVEGAPWKAKTMDILDPFGNGLRFNQSEGHEESDRKPAKTVKRSSKTGRRARKKASRSRRQA